MVTSVLQRQQESAPPTPERTRLDATRLTAAAGKGDSRVEVENLVSAGLEKLSLLAVEKLGLSSVKVVCSLGLRYR